MESVKFSEIAINEHFISKDYIFIKVNKDTDMTPNRQAYYHIDPSEKVEKIINKNMLNVIVTPNELLVTKDSNRVLRFTSITDAYNALCK